MSQSVSDVIRSTPYQVVVDEHGEEVRVQATYGIHNGYFTVTGDGWYKTPAGRYHNEPDICGQISSELIDAAFPWLNLIRSLHLTDALTGEPMYAVENTLFWLRSGADDSITVPAKWELFDGRQRAAAYLGAPVHLMPSLAANKDEQRAELTALVADLAPAFSAKAYAARVLYDLGEVDTAQVDSVVGAVMDSHYGADSEWAEPNRFDEVGFTRAQAENDISAVEIEELMTEAITLDRKAFYAPGRIPNTKEN